MTSAPTIQSKLVSVEAEKSSSIIFFDFSPLHFFASATHSGQIFLLTVKYLKNAFLGIGAFTDLNQTEHKILCIYYELLASAEIFKK